ncbi:minor tail protein [Arthrobacter phage Wollypog]|uniref:Minor tail protein n=1 Tax=Arthrobacter phage Wollypog TaxID=2790985 RepID=A0A7T3KC80_9CAUD|nr:minor tail protein [Arthrobacter phage Wollypog]QPX62573.1 minor tail protein [Arthrobacter phage Wollypog]
MANSTRYGWRLPDATDQPVIHLDIPALAADIEDTLYKAPQLVTGFPKIAAPTTVGGWKGDRLICYKWKLGDNHFKYEFAGYIARSSNLTLTGNASATTIANFLDTDISINGGPASVPNGYTPTILQGSGSMFMGIQFYFMSRDLLIRSTNNVSLNTAHNIVVPNAVFYSNI